MKYIPVIFASLLTFGCQSTSEDHTVSFQETLNNKNLDLFKKNDVDVVFVKLYSLKKDNKYTSEHTVELDKSASVKSKVNSPLGIIDSINFTYSLVDDELNIEFDEYTTDGVYPSKTITKKIKK